ncbi:hypothetical protein HYFRA_00010742 [Hymenoscyphus fraxineus]|uniref:Uncharacterized protein n=1 Tax=Hymenoscyphus fraxineus TaxID=746836 RepID=A0A9N9PKN2_9HELO|nr:hypothetical protein HYFRA_00010742 [Hymenoscyphus fraxineus]
MQQTPEVQSNSMIRAARRVSSCLSVKTSVTRVSGMKALLPLTLSTTSFDTQVYRPQQVEEFESPTTTINRFTFGGHDESPKKQKSPRSKKLSRRGGHFPRLPLYIRPERRDIPVYTEHGSPVPSPAYFTSQFPNLNNPSPTHSSSDEDWAVGCSSPNTETSHPNDRMYTMDAIKISPDQSFGSSTTGKNAKSYDSSEMSFQCLGEHGDVKEPEGFQNPYDEMPNLDSMCLPDILAQSMPPECIVEGWLGSAHSTDDECGSISEALPPPVSMGRASTAFDSAFELQPGSSSITGARPTIIWNSRSKIRTNGMAAYNSSPLTAYDSHAPSPTFDTESIASSATSHDEPPTPPPKERNYSPRIPSSHGISSSNPFQHPQSNNLTLDIRENNANLHGCALSIIEELIRYFPFSTFIDYRHHIYTLDPEHLRLLHVPKNPTTERHSEKQDRK